MNVLFTGKGRGGSWIIRGEQLGGSIGRTIKRATLEDMRAADLIVLVKRPSPGMIENIRLSGKPWVWDIVDIYPQPACTHWSRERSISWIRRKIAAYSPNAVIWPNERMADDCGARASDLVLYHHHRPSIIRNPIRGSIRRVGYEGAAYLGRWEPALRRLCLERGWEFCPNQGSHATWDVCVAFRDVEFNGYAQRHWKSNVKLANSHGSGTPFLGAPESGYVETQAGGEVWCRSQGMLAECFDVLESQTYRQSISQAFLSNAFTLGQSAKTLSAWLATV